MDKKLWVIIPFYLDAEALSKCRACLDASTFKQWEVYVRDNSQDNIYFTAAVNEGFRAGLADPSVTDFLVLNQDCYVEAKSIENLLEHMAQYPLCGIACPLQLDNENNVTWGGSLDSFPLGAHLKHSLNQYEDPFTTYWANGACMLIRRTTLEEVGLFDKNFRFVCSDSDFSFSARARGWEIHVVPAARARHSLSGSNKSAPAAINLIKAEDILYFYDKWVSGGLYRQVSYEGSTLVSSEIEAWVQSLRTDLAAEKQRLAS
jgi:hypothetical protein